jgi:sporulation protein YlmC with PRC-barrel domain
MNRQKIAPLALAALLGLAAAGGADGQQLARNDFAGGYPEQRLALLVRTSDIIGTMVWDHEGRRLGRIQDFLVDPASWRIVCALIRPVNLYGPKDYFVAVPARSFVSADAERAVVDATVTNFIGLPRFPMDANRDAAAMSQSLKQMFDQFGQKVYWDEKKGLAQIVRCGTWLGMEVNDQSGVNVGSLADFVLDLPAERVVFAAVDFFGWDSNIHILPPGALSAAPNSGSLRLEMDNARVAGFANSDAFLWTKTSDPAWVGSVYRAYGEQFPLAPAPSLDAAIARVRAPADPHPLPPPTPRLSPAMPSGEASPEVNLARAVMIAIIHADAANAALEIKASAKDDKVTLTGQVKSEEQKSALGRIAERVAGTGRVVNQLEVK